LKFKMATSAAHQGLEFALHNVELANRRHKAAASATVFIDMPQYLYRFQSGIGDPVGLHCPCIRHGMRCIVCFT
jgi:hypothetical protein